LKKRLRNIRPFGEALLNSYSLLFFSNNRLFGFLLIVVSFFNPYAGLAGVIAAVLSLTAAYFTGLDRVLVRDGLYSYNAVIIGLGMGTVYNYSVAFWLLLFVIVIFSVILSVMLQNLLSRYRLPFLTIPFVLCFWLVMLVTKDFAAIDFTYRNIYWINDLYAFGDANLVKFFLFMENLQVPPLVSAFFRSLSSLYFQNNILTGMLIALGMLLHSRIIFSLIVLGFAAAYGFNTIVMANPEGANNYLMGVNYILVSVAVGGFFTIPSLHTYLWAIFSVPITFLIVMGLGKLTGQWNLPVYSMPFSITTLCLLFFFSLKAHAGKVVLTPRQFYSPEKNLYNYLSNKERLVNVHKVRLHLPFIGKWMVSQGYNGSITHKGEWSKALDFIIVDAQLKTYEQAGTEPENFYCFGKPVLAPADGFIQQVEDHIDDNEIGRINKQQNWGNSIVIKHAEGLYTKITHLKKDSVKVKTGEYVKRGNIIASCGNSGRSPEPHLHFQVQTAPYIGSKTFAYPLAHFIAEKNGVPRVKEFAIPDETDIVYRATPCSTLQKAFEFPPGYNLTVTADLMPEGRWEVFTDAWNNSYIYCHNSKAMAWFMHSEEVFCFTSFTGNRNSLLYYFYLACYKVYLSVEPALPATDKFPLQLNRGNFTQWLQDLLSPFIIFSRLHYRSLNKVESPDPFNPSFIIESLQTGQFLSHSKTRYNFTVAVKDDRVVSFTFQKNNKTITAKCSPKDY
jgi:urea transporter